MRKKELHTFEVRQFEFSHPTFGKCIDEVWTCKETGKQFRAFDMPSRGFYHPETYEPFVHFWTRENGEPGREGGKPDRIAYHEANPHMRWHAPCTLSNGEIATQQIYSAFPKHSEIDPLSGRLRHIYSGVVDIAYDAGNENLEFPEPTYDRPLTTATPKLISPE